MVNFDTLKLGLEVEFVIDQNTNAIHTGFIRYKGAINGKGGDWVGVEAREPVGYCDGRLMGNCYFSCQDKYGLFFNADDLRIVTNRVKK